MHYLSKRDSLMFTFYPGLKKNASTFKEAREYNDLNYITIKKFRIASIESGFQIEYLYVKRPKYAWLFMSIFPILKRTILNDILSIGTTAILKKETVIHFNSKQIN